MICKYCEQTWSSDDAPPRCRAILCPARPCVAMTAQTASEVVDVLMTALDRISTMHEGSPRAHDVAVHDIAAEALRAGNAYLNGSPA